MNWYIEVMKKYAVFSGRARRREYWMFVLFNIIIALVLSIIEGIADAGSENNRSVLATLYGLAVRTFRSSPLTGVVLPMAKPAY